MEKFLSLHIILEFCLKHLVASKWDSVMFGKELQEKSVFGHINILERRWFLDMFTDKNGAN